MPETITVMINGSPVVIEKTLTSGDLLLSTLMTIILTLMIAMIVITIIGGKK